MNTLRFGRALCTGVAIALLAGCGALPFDSAQGRLPQDDMQPPSSAPGAVPQATPLTTGPTGITAAGWLSPEARTGKARVYVASQSGSGVLIYAEEAGGKLMGEITAGISAPYGLYVDQNGTLYVANNGNDTVTAYPAGSKSPSSTWSQDLQSPLYPIVDGNGDLFVSNQGNGTVVEYPSRSTSAHQVLQTPGRETDGMDFDSQGNLYVAYRTSDRQHAGGIEEFAPGSTQGKILPMKLIAPQGLVIDHRGNILVVETETKDRIALFPPGHKFKSASITFPPGYGSILTQLAIKADEKELFASAIDGAVFTTAYPFPQSGTLSALLKADASLQGMALSNGQTF